MKKHISLFLLIPVLFSACAIPAGGSATTIPTPTDTRLPPTLASTSTAAPR